MKILRICLNSFVLAVGCLVSILIGLGFFHMLRAAWPVDQIMVPRNTFEDNCPNVYNPSQEDYEGDRIGGVCDPDDDNDGVCDPGFSDPSCSGSDSCQYDPYNDSDGDNLCGDADNCPATYNPNQEDTYPPGGNGIGNACECEGNFNCFEDVDVDGSDASTFKTDFGRSPYLNPCNAGDPCNGNFNCDQDVDGGDAALFKTDFGRSGFVNPCPTCTQGQQWCE